MYNFLAPFPVSSSLPPSCLRVLFLSRSLSRALSLSISLCLSLSLAASLSVSCSNRISDWRWGCSTHTCDAHTHIHTHTLTRSRCWHSTSRLQGRKSDHYLTSRIQHTHISHTHTPTHTHTLTRSLSGDTAHLVHDDKNEISAWRREFSTHTHDTHTHSLSLSLCLSLTHTHWLALSLVTQHISFTTTKIGSLLDVEDSADPEGLRVFYYLIQVNESCRTSLPLHISISTYIYMHPYLYLYTFVSMYISVGRRRFSWPRGSQCLVLPYPGEWVTSHVSILHIYVSSISTHISIYIYICICIYLYLRSRI